MPDFDSCRGWPGLIAILRLPDGERAPGIHRTFLLDDGSAADGSSGVVETIPASDQFTLQAEAFSRAVLGQESLHWGGEDAILNMRVLDALFR